MHINLLSYTSRLRIDAAMAQSVERVLGKDEVPSSNLGSSSRKNSLRFLKEFFQ